MNQLYFGDNLHVLRESIADESVDLIYLDPPFNSKRDYNLLFKSPKGQQSEAQITAFEDSWHWDEQAEREFDELLHQANTDVAEMMKALRTFLGENEMMAYLTMMANRLRELHRSGHRWLLGNDSRIEQPLLAHATSVADLLASIADVRNCRPR